MDVDVEGRVTDTSDTGGGLWKMFSGKDSAGPRYSVDLNRMVQINSQSGFERAVLRQAVPIYKTSLKLTSPDGGSSVSGVATGSAAVGGWAASAAAARPPGAPGADAGLGMSSGANTIRATSLNRATSSPLAAPPHLAKRLSRSGSNAPPASKTRKARPPTPIDALGAEEGASGSGLTTPYHIALTVLNHPIGAITTNASVDLSTLGGKGVGGDDNCRGGEGGGGVKGGRGGRGGGGSGGGDAGGGAGLTRAGSGGIAGPSRLRFGFGGRAEKEEEQIPPLPEDLHAIRAPVLLLSRGQLIQVLKKRDDGWWHGSVVYQTYPDRGSAIRNHRKLKFLKKTKSKGDDTQTRGSVAAGAAMSTATGAGAGGGGGRVAGAQTGEVRARRRRSRRGAGGFRHDLFRGRPRCS